MNLKEKSSGQHKGQIKITKRGSGRVPVHKGLPYRGSYPNAGTTPVSRLA